ncbi:MAG: hypothetical protein NVS9B12_11810 [Vulcanimicrobiaceae bacterium]
MVERREFDLLDAAARFAQASRQSSAAVLGELERCLRRAEPHADVILIFSVQGEELAPLTISGERATYFEQARYHLAGPPNVLLQAAAAGHRAVAAPGLPALIPTDSAALAVPLLEQPVPIVVYVSAAACDRLETADMLVQLIEQAGPPLALARDREVDREKATYDGLTGLFSPRAFRSALAGEVKIARVTSNAAISLWFIDTDNFKAVNDTHGHSTGDAVLQHMARLLQAHATPGIDIVARNGGDEFCAVVKNVPKSVAIERAQRFCEAVASADFGTGLSITASIGVASYPSDCATANLLLEAADAAMYHSKRNGRNCVSFAVGDMRFERYAYEGLEAETRISVDALPPCLDHAGCGTLDGILRSRQQP